jgi:hypothetical protein
MCDNTAWQNKQRASPAVIFTCQMQSNKTATMRKIPWLSIG